MSPSEYEAIDYRTRVACDNWCGTEFGVTEGTSWPSVLSKLSPGADGTGQDLRRPGIQAIPAFPGPTVVGSLPTCSDVGKAIQAFLFGVPP